MHLEINSMPRNNLLPIIRSLVFIISPCCNIRHTEVV